MLENLVVEFAWQLRLSHEGRACLVMERPGRRLRFDPLGPVLADDLVILTGADPMSYEHVVANPHVIRPHGKEVQTEIDGMQFEGIPYIPPQNDGRVSRLAAAIREPADAARRWMAKRSLDPHMVWQITFPIGERLVHLGHAFHAETHVGWAADVVTRFGGARWVIVGAPYGHYDAVLNRIAAMSATHLLVADLQSDIRRAAGRPTKLLTPLVDQMESAGLPVMIFVSQSSIRFE